MKKTYFLLIAICFLTIAKAQIVNIPDANFKAKLLAASPTNKGAKDLTGNYFKIDANNDQEIQVSEALNVSYLYLYSYLDEDKISSMTGIANFTNIKELYCDNNVISTLDLSGLTSLQFLDCSNNKITSLNVDGANNLKILKCHTNLLSSIDLSGLINLSELECGGNSLLNLDVNGLISLTDLRCCYNKLKSLNIDGLTNLLYISCYNNELTSITLNELPNLKLLQCNDNKIPFLNVKGLSNLYQLDCANNQLPSLDLSGLVKLNNLKCSYNQLPSLNLNGLVDLQMLDCSYNQLTSLSLSGLTTLATASCYNNLISSLDFTDTDLRGLYCSNNKLTSLDISNVQNLSSLYCDNNLLTTLFIKNGKNESELRFSDNPNLEYICADENQISQIQNKINEYTYTNCHVNSYCTFSPGGTFYTIQGNNRLDDNSNGCDINDINFPNLKFNFSDGIISGSLISDNSGNYSYDVQSGTHMITPVLENPAYFDVSPTAVNVTFPTQASPFVQDFCITANGVHPDLEVTLLPLRVAIPGFDIKYKIVYKNKGNTTQSGSVNLAFDDAVLDLVVANPVVSTQTVNNLSWNFTDLKPFENREITLTLNVNSPMEMPAVNSGSVLPYTVTITSAATDETPIDNSFTLNQTAVNSFDPNDKTCLEGDVISPNLIGEYVHYMIRFENTGTYPAQNIVVKDMIDLSKFDISTLVPTSSSHSFVTNISSGNKVEFIFENINLPFDDANNDGYIAFKIKTKPTLVVGDTFTNDASIYFDYNFPIVTKLASSTFKTLATQDFEFSNYFTLYPNPVNNVLNISTQKPIDIQSLAIYDVLGQVVIAIPDAKTVSGIDVSKLTTGNYFIKVKSDKGISNMKFIKK